MNNDANTAADLRRWYSLKAGPPLFQAFRHAASEHMRPLVDDSADGKSADPLHSASSDDGVGEGGARRIPAVSMALPDADVLASVPIASANLIGGTAEPGETTPLEQPSSLVQTVGVEPAQDQALPAQALNSSAQSTDASDAPTSTDDRRPTGHRAPIRTKQLHSGSGGKTEDTEGVANIGTGADVAPSASSQNTMSRCRHLLAGRRHFWYALIGLCAISAIAAPFWLPSSDPPTEFADWIGLLYGGQTRLLDVLSNSEALTRWDEASQGVIPAVASDRIETLLILLRDHGARAADGGTSIGLLPPNLCVAIAQILGWNAVGVPDSASSNQPPNQPPSQPSSQPPNQMAPLLSCFERDRLLKTQLAYLTDEHLEDLLDGYQVKGAEADNIRVRHAIERDDLPRLADLLLGNGVFKGLDADLRTRAERFLAQHVQFVPTDTLRAWHAVRYGPLPTSPAPAERPIWRLLELEYMRRSGSLDSADDQSRRQSVEDALVDAKTASDDGAAAATSRLLGVYWDWTSQSQSPRQRKVRRRKYVEAVSSLLHSSIDAQELPLKVRVRLLHQFLVEAAQRAPSRLATQERDALADIVRQLGKDMGGTDSVKSAEVLQARVLYRFAECVVGDADCRSRELLNIDTDLPVKGAVANASTADDAGVVVGFDSLAFDLMALDLKDLKNAFSSYEKGLILLRSAKSAGDQVTYDNGRLLTKHYLAAYKPTDKTLQQLDWAQILWWSERRSELDPRLCNHSRNASGLLQLPGLACAPRANRSALSVSRSGWRVQIDGATEPWLDRFNIEWDYLSHRVYQGDDAIPVKRKEALRFWGFAISGRDETMAAWNTANSYMRTLPQGFPTSARNIIGAYWYLLIDRWDDVQDLLAFDTYWCDST